MYFLAFLPYIHLYVTILPAGVVEVGEGLSFAAFVEQCSLLAIHPPMGS